MRQEVISGNVREAYDQFYQDHDRAWRMLGAKYKAQNIADVSKGRKFTKVLEVGAGDGSILHYLDEWNFAPELYALEISESGVEAIRGRNLRSLRSAQVFDGYTTPFKDDEFDLVILSHVLEHVEFERMLLREIKRISKFQVIEVPKDYRYGVDKRMKHFLGYGHINMYTPTSLRFLLQSEGFRVLNDKLSMIHPEVTKFGRFIRQKQTKSFLKSLKIDLEFMIKGLAGHIFGKKKREAFTNAYTVLTEKETDLQIF
jgi:SAM-dependent methyltransferase